MKQKLENFRKDIRRNQLRQKFQSMRTAALQYSTQFDPFSTNQADHQDYHNTVQIEGFSLTEAEIYQQWKEEEQQLIQETSHSNYQAAAYIISNVLTALKRVVHTNNMLFQRRSPIDHVFLDTGILRNIIKSVVAADRDKCATATLQKLIRLAVEVLNYVINFKPKIFGEDFFLYDAFLPFLGICNSNPDLDKDHFQRIVTIMTHLIIVSTADKGRLLDLLNDMKSPFNISALFNPIFKFSPKPKEEININFLIVIKYYLLQVEAKKIPLNLSNHYVDVCLQMAIQSVNFYLENGPINSKEAWFNLEDSLEVTKILVQKSNIDNKWLYHIQYRRLVEILHVKGCPSEIIYNIFVIVDHIICIDTQNGLTSKLIKDCELISTIWTRRQDYLDYILNILCNLASQEQYKQHLVSYLPLIFLNVRLTKHISMLNKIIFNWFCSQSFQIRNSNDQLIISFFAESEATQTEIVEKEAAIWIKLKEVNNYQMVPKKVIGHDNPSSEYLRKVFMSQQDEVV